MLYFLLKKKILVEKKIILLYLYTLIYYQNLEMRKQNKNILYLITNTNYFFFLKKINCLELCVLEAEIASFFTKFKNFYKNKKCNLILFIYCDLLLKNLR